MKILIVEDDVMLALSMEESLREVGHILVGLARDPATAFRIAKASRPDLALVDLTLARGTSGAEVARHLRRHYGVRSIFVSGSPAECKAIGWRAGALGCLAKPFTPDELTDAVDVGFRLLQRQNPERIPANLELYYVI